MSENSKYPLLPFAQYVYDSTRWMPWTYFFQLKIRTKAISFEQAQAIVYQILGNHPVFRSRIDWRGRQYAGKSTVRFSSPYYKIKLRQKDEWLYANVGMSLILGDGYSIKVLLNDIYLAFQGEKLQKDDYWGYVERYEQLKSGLHYAQSKEWLEKEFADNSMPVRPTIDRKWLSTLLPPRVGICEDNYSDLQQLIRPFLMLQRITMDGFFSLCTALAIAEYCGTDTAALTWAYDGRERPEEQHVIGSLHRDVPFKISFQSSQREDLIRQARNQIRSGIAHSDYPYTLISPNNKRWNYAVNVLRVPDIKMLIEQFPIPLEIISFPKQKYAYALLDVEIHESFENFKIVYRYSATHYKESSIKKFAALVRKYAEWLLE